MTYKESWDRTSAEHTSISYNKDVGVHTIANPVPTPEEMGDILGLSSDRVNAVRKIMSTPSAAKRSRSGGAILRKPAAKKSRRVSGKK